MGGEDMRHEQIAKIKGTKPLTASEEAAAWEAGDRDKVIIAHLHLARKMAETFARRWHMDPDDLASEAFCGLVNAARKYDPAHGVRYYHYCQLWIRAHLWRYIMANWRILKIGTSHIQRKLFFQLKKEFMHIEERGGDTSPAGLADHFDCDVSEILIMQQILLQHDIPLDAPATAEEDLTVADAMALTAEGEDTAEDTHTADMVDRLHRVVDGFLEDKSGGDKRWSIIIYRRLLADEPATLQVIGDMVGVTRERIRQLEHIILTALKKYIKAKDPGLAALFRRKRDICQ